MGNQYSATLPFQELYELVLLLLHIPGSPFSIASQFCHHQPGKSEKKMYDLTKIHSVLSYQMSVQLSTGNSEN